MNEFERLFAPSKINIKVTVSISKRTCKVKSDMIENQDLVAPRVLKELNKIQFGTRQRISRAGNVYYAHSAFRNYNNFQRG